MKKLIVAIILLISAATAYSNTAVVGSMWKQIGSVLFPADDITEINYAGITTAELANVNVVADLPASPQEGAFYLYSGVGRRVLYERVDSTWETIQSFGNMVIYVDGASGTDVVNCGTAAGASACDTIQYAVDQIPGSVGGNTTVNISADTYTETVVIQGKSVTGDYTIAINGTLALQETASSAAVVAGSGATQGTVTKVGAFTGDSYANLLAYLVTDDEYRVIDSHTNDVLTLVGTAPSSTAQDVRIYDWGTIISNGSEPGLSLIAQKGIVTNDISYGSSGLWAIFIETYSALTANNTEATAGVISSINSLINPSKFVINHSGTWGFYASQLSTIDAEYTKVIGPTGECFRGISGAVCTVRSGTILDGANYGFRMQALSAGQTSGNAASGYIRIRNCGTVGVQADTNSAVVQTANNQYSGNTTDESTDASGAYID